jgi:hypothetical protein
MMSVLLLRISVVSPEVICLASKSPMFGQIKVRFEMSKFVVTTRYFVSNDLLLYSLNK